MAVSFASYEIARTGLFVNERGLYVTGHNISNVNTPGYVRQQAIISTAQYQTQGKYQLGLGADIEDIRQIRHSFLDNVYRQESTTLGYWESKNKTIQDIQSILGEPMGSGLQDVMNQFWDSWQELSKQPDSLTVRALVRQRGEALTQQINHVGTQIDKLQNDLNSEIKVRIDEVNEITQKIADLNVQILKVEVSKDSANDYRDQRNLLVDRLCKLADVEITEMQDSQIDITLGGYFLVTKGIQNKLYADENKTGGQFVVPKLAGTNIEVPMKSGIIKGLMEARGEVFGATGSVENGSAYDKMDLVFAVSRDATAAQKADIIANAQAMVNNYKNIGIDVRLGYVEFDDSNIYSYNPATSTYSNAPAFASDFTDFSNRINSMTTSAVSAPKGLEALKSAENMIFRNNAIKQFVLVTNSTLDVTTNSVEGVAGELKNAGINTSVIGPAGGGIETQLDELASQTGSSYYDITDASAYTDGIYAETKDKIYNNVFHTQNIISDLRNKLNLFVNIMAREVNSLHSSGKTLDGNNGSAFFTAINNAYPLEMGNLKLNDNLLNLNNIVASASGSTGDNTLALSLANLRHSPLVGKASEATSLDDFYRSIILQVGNDGNDAARITENQQQLVDSADASRQSITGVSMDEEMTNMMKYKYAYDAASKAMNVIDEMIETVVNRMGITGR